MDSMSRLLRAAVVFTGVSLGTTAFAEPSPHAAQDAERGEQQFKKGTRAFEEQHFTEAYAALRSAWDLAPSYRTAAGLGQVELHLGQYRDAAEHLSYCLRHYPTDADPRARSFIEQGLDDARGHVAALRVRVNVEGADVQVDGVAAGKSPLEGPLFVDPGSHVVTASHDGETARASVEGRVRATEEVSLTLAIKAAEAPAVAPPPVVAPVPAGVESSPEAPPPSHGLPPSTWVLIVGGSLTAAALGTSIGFHVKGSDAGDDADALRGQIGTATNACRGSRASIPSPCAALDDKLDDRNNANRVALGAAIGTGVFAVATAVTFVVLKSSERSKTATASGPRPLSVGFAPAPGGGFVSFHGGF
jgi:hypothetical protein